MSMTPLDELRREQGFSYPDLGSTPLILLLPVLTRWTSHYLACARLLELSTAIRACCIRHAERMITCVGRDRDAIARADRVLNTVKDDRFWARLARQVNRE